MNSFHFFNPTHITFGADTLNKLNEVVPGNLKKRIMLVTGKTSMRRLGYIDRIIALLDRHEVLVYDGVRPNPDIDIMEEGTELARHSNIDTVIGLGGGSSIDAGKIIAFAAAQDLSVKDLLESTILTANKRLFFIAIPTTAGSGSEVTKWATIWDHKRKQKHSLEHHGMFPDNAIIDPLLHISMPSDVTAVTGLDSLCHAMEAYWANNAQPISDMFAVKAMELIYENILNAFHDPENAEYREAMAKGSLFAGLAFSNTRTTACHSISYPITAHFGVSHGHACALTLPHLLEFNAPSLKDKTGAIISLFKEDSIEGTSHKLEGLVQKLGLETKLSMLNIHESDIGIILDEGCTPSRADNNPKELKRSDMELILEKIR